MIIKMPKSLVICFAILASSIAWQVFIYGKMGPSSRSESETILSVMGIPAIIGGIIIVGSISWSVLILIDPNTHATLSGQIKFVGTIIVLAIIFFIKNLFGAVLSGATLSWAIYMWYQYGSIELIPIFQMVIDAFMPWAPTWMKVLYIWVTLIYAFISSVISSGFD